MTSSRASAVTSSGCSSQARGSSRRRRGSRLGSSRASRPRSASPTSASASAHRPASRWVPGVARPPSCCARRTWPCTRPSGAGVGSRSSRPARTRLSCAATGSPRTCPGPSSGTSWSWCTSPSWSSTPGGSWRSRRCCAGATPRRASCRRRASSPSRNARTSSRRWTRGPCARRHRRWRPGGGAGRQRETSPCT